MPASSKDLRDLLTMAQRQLDREVGEARSVANRGREVLAEVESTQANIQNLEQAIGVLQGIGDERQRAAQEQIEALVTHGLSMIFGTDMSFHIVNDVRRNLAVSDLVVRSIVDGQYVDTPVMDARGGGVAAVVGFMLRLVVLLLRKDELPILFLDETFAQLSSEYEPRLAEFLRELVDKTPVQLVMVTHSTAFDDVADRIYRFGTKDGNTQVKALS